MNPLVLDRKPADANSPPAGASSTEARNRPALLPPRHADPGGAGETDRARSLALGASDRLSPQERRQRSETLAHILAGATDVDELVAVIKEHGRLAAARAAAVRPDLVPVINGEFAHIALSLADLD